MAKSRNKNFRAQFLFHTKIKTTYQNELLTKLGLVADPVIEAIAKLEFEDGLRTGVLLGGCWGP